MLLHDPASYLHDIHFPCRLVQGVHWSRNYVFAHLSLSLLFKPSGMYASLVNLGASTSLVDFIWLLFFCPYSASITVILSFPPFVLPRLPGNPPPAEAFRWPAPFGVLHLKDNHSLSEQKQQPVGYIKTPLNGPVSTLNEGFVPMALVSMFLCGCVRPPRLKCCHCLRVPVHRYDPV